MAVNPAGNATFQRAMAALQAKNFEDAERLFRDVLRGEPKHVAALNILAVVLIQRAKFADAETFLQRALSESPDSEATLYNYGIALKALHRPAEALDRFSQALRINPQALDSWNNRGTVLNDLKRHDEAIADFDKALALDPNYAEAYCNKGKSLNAAGRFTDALAAFGKAATLRPDLAEAWAGCGYSYFGLNRHNDALAGFEKALTIRPDLAAAWLGKGNACAELGHHAEAVAAYERALMLKPDLAEAKLGRGFVLLALKRGNEALAAFDEALALKPDLPEAWLGRGHALTESPSEAFAAYDQALTLKPDYVEAWVGRGHLCAKLKQNDEAFDAYDKALALRADLAEAWLGRGHVLSNLGRYDEALTAYDKAQAIKSDMPEAWYARSHVFNCLQRHNEAVAASDRGLDLKPDYADALVERGDALLALQRFTEALAAYDKAVLSDQTTAAGSFGRANAFSRVGPCNEVNLSAEKAPGLQRDINFIESKRLLAKLYLCDWTDFAEEEARLLSAMREKSDASLPFASLSIVSTAVDQLESAKRFNGMSPSFSPLAVRAYAHDRIRLAYISSDLHDHAVGYLTVGLFEHHDKSRFEVTAISLGGGRDSDFRRRIRAAFDRVIDIDSESDQEIAELIRGLEIDILVDLNGFTRGYRRGVFARRAAPIQINYLGFAGTLGADFFDYIIADPVVIPREHFDCYSERVVWLPDTFFVNDASRRIAERTPSRSELGLPDDKFVFCCFNQSYKINPSIFDIWMRLLRTIDRSVLWLKDNGDVATRNLRLEAERRGVAPDRLIFASHAPSIEDHLARQRQADLFLDTLPYNAHTTTADALWAGVPVLTCLGDTFAGRVAASLVRAVGLPELVTESTADYEDLALKLAREPDLLAALKAKLGRTRTVFPLFDTARFTRNIEAAYATMWERSCRGEQPAHFAVEDKK